ncbi:MAG TPA: DUF3857 domain-containing protein [Thermoanaerobaculia bacterium]|nr:DUF3857 domain-containing protein [Thermoanaerobaculia bacterium]
MVRKLILLALLPAALHAKSYGEFDVAPPPRWVDRIAAEVEFAVPRNLARYGVYDILSDHQIRVAPDGATAHYFRTVRKVLTQAGVQNASEVTIDFDPSFQRLVIHEVTILRGGQGSSALHPADIRVIEKEDESENGIYDGRLTALLFLKDVRAGDVIDWSWSIDGANPILRGRYADQYDLRSEVPSHRIRHRLLWEGTRPLQSRGQTPVKEGNTFTWEVHNAAAVDLEDALPSWYEPWESVDVTDFASWSEVAQWAAVVFEADDESRAAVKDLAQKIRRDHPDDPITAAIRFVQDDIRYLGLEIGRNSHEPRQPAEILEQRWGDCKEKALLLSLLLRELGLEADSALVNTKAKHRLDRRLPSPFAFDHVVVRASAPSPTGRGWRGAPGEGRPSSAASRHLLPRGEGSAYWVDPTIADQGGTLETIETPNDARALVVSEYTTDLVRIGIGHRGRTIIEESYTALDATSPTTLVIRTTYSGGDGDVMRAELSSLAPDEIGKERLNRYAADHPSIIATAAPRIDDDRLRNVIVITERYSIRDLWKRGEWTYDPHAIETSLEKPKTVIRSMPLAFDYPLDIVQRATFRFPSGATFDAEPISRTTPAFAFRLKPSTQERSVTLEYSLRALRDSVPASDVPRHLMAINDINDDIACTIRPSFVTTAEMRVIGGAMQRWLWGGAVALAIAGLAVARYWKLSAGRGRFSRHRVMTVRD